MPPVLASLLKEGKGAGIKAQSNVTTNAAHMSARISYDLIRFLSQLARDLVLYPVY